MGCGFTAATCTSRVTTRCISPFSSKREWRGSRRLCIDSRRSITRPDDVRIPSHSLEVMDRAERTLNEVFGLDAFRPGQADVVAAMLAGRDVLSVAPTGSGKSIS